MRLTLLLTMFFSFTAIASVSSQSVTLKLENASLRETIKELKNQTGVYFVFNEEEIASLNVKLNMVLTNEPFEKALDRIFKGLPFNYEYVKGVVIIKPVPQKDDEMKLKMVKGKVIDTDGYPLPGVTIQVKGSTSGTSTDKDGRYKLLLPGGRNLTLMFSFIGMEPQEVKYTGQDSINVTMKETAAMLEEVVVNTGYTSQSVRKITSAVTSVRAEDVVLPGLQSIDQMLEGRIPGMIFMQNTGQIGAAPRLRIRGTSTVLGSQEPLWVVDGIVQTDPVNVDPSQLNDLDFVNLLGNAISGLNPEDIEQIDVLKDASATAIYGARAANGVIVITTKKGKAGPPRFNYSVSGSITRRPHYSDKSVNMMNSTERIAYSRELIQKRIEYPTIETWVGYEDAMRKYWNGEYSYDQMSEVVGYYEALNTDWFDILTQNAFTHKHTLSVSGGANQFGYYASLGYSDINGTAKGESNKMYTANVKLTSNYNRFSMQFGLNANIQEKEYTPDDVGLVNYAYNTSRAVPAYDENGELLYYNRPYAAPSRINGDENQLAAFNILNEIANSSQDINSSGVSLNATVNYNLFDFLKLSTTLSYTLNHTEMNVYHGEKSYYVACLRHDGGTSSLLPVGGELKESNTRNNSYMARAQLDFNHYMDSNRKHLLFASAGWEVSSTKYTGISQTYRGYVPERGLKMTTIDLEKYPYYAQWTQTAEALGQRTHQLTNLMSVYFSGSYSYNDVYMFNVNGRMDYSNAFGSRSNEKILPIWSISGRWNVAQDILKNVYWVNDLSLRASFGYQGNMLEGEGPDMVIQRGSMDPYFGEYKSTVYKFANPFLKWEKTASTNLTIDFSLFNSKVNGSVSYYYKKTRDAFLEKTVSEINGVTEYMVNQGTLKNKGVEVSLNFVPIDQISAGNPNGFRWKLDPQIGQVINQLIDKAIDNKDATVQDEIVYQDYLDGSINIAGRPLNSFYSYKFAGLDPKDGRPTFYGISDEELNSYITMDKEEMFKSVMAYSGCRVPDIQGSILNTFTYHRFTLSVNMAYSFGSKIRLLQLYPNISLGNGTLAPQPLENVRREFLDRWQRPGDEKYTNIPGILPNSEFINTVGGGMQGENGVWPAELRNKSFAENIWQMYDNSDVRVVSGNYVKMQSFSLRYSFSDRFCQKMHLKSAYIGFSGTNLFTICSKDLKGQDPTTQTGSAGTINMSIRPTYSFNLNIAF